MKKKILFYFFNCISQENENEIVINSVDTYKESQENENEIVVNSVDTYKESQENENEIVVNPIENHKEKPEEIKKKNKKIYTDVALFCLMVFVLFVIIYLYKRENSLKRCIIKGQMEKKFRENVNIVVHIKKNKNTFDIEFFDKAKTLHTILKRETKFSDEFLPANPLLSMAKHLLENKTFDEIKQDLKNKKSFFLDKDSIYVSVKTFLSFFSYVQISVVTKPAIAEKIKRTVVIFSRKTETKEQVSTIDDFLFFLTDLFYWSSFYNLFTNEDDLKTSDGFHMLHKYKENRLVFSIENGYFKKKTVLEEDWKESIVEQKEITYLFNLLNRGSCFFFRKNGIFFLEKGKYGFFSLEAFLKQKISSTDMPITFLIQEKAQKAGFLNSLLEKQLKKKNLNLTESLNFAQDFSLGKEKSFSIKEQFIDKNLLTAEEILAAINQP